MASSYSVSGMLNSSSSPHRGVSGSNKMVIKSHRYLSSMWSKFYEFYKNGRHLDFKILVGEKTFQAHKIVLAAASDFFSALLESQMVESASNESTLPDVDPVAFSTLLDFMYKGLMTVSLDSVSSLLHAASFLQIKTALALLEEFMTEELDPNTATMIYSLADRYSLHDLKFTALNFVLRSFVDDIGASPQLHDFSQGQLTEILSSNTLRCNSEYQLCRIAIRWLNHVNPLTDDLCYEILQHIRFPLMTTEELVKPLSSEDIMTRGRCNQLLAEAKNFHLFRNVPAMLTCNYSPRCQVRNEDRIIAIGGCFSFHGGPNVSSNHHGMFMFDSERWISLQCKNSNLECRGRNHPNRPSMVCVYKNFLYAYNLDSGNFWLFDPRFQEFSSLASPPSSLLLMANQSPIGSKKLYGITRQEKRLVIYLPEADAWYLAPPLPTKYEMKQQQQSNPTLWNSNFASGDSQSVDSGERDRGYGFPGDIHICVSGSDLYILVDKNLYCFNTSSEEYRKLSNHLSVSPAHGSFQSVCGMFADDSRVYVIGRSSSNSSIKRIMSFTIETNQWNEIEVNTKFCVRPPRNLDSCITVLPHKKAVYILNNSASPDNGSKCRPNCLHKICLEELRTASLSNKSRVTMTPVHCICQRSAASLTPQWQGSLVPLALPQNFVDKLFVDKLRSELRH